MLLSYAKQFKTTEEDYTHVISKSRYKIASNVDFMDKYIKYINEEFVYEYNTNPPLILEFKVKCNKEADDHISRLINKLNNLLKRNYEITNDILRSYVVWDGNIIRITYPNITINSNHKEHFLKQLNYDTDILKLKNNELIKMFNEEFELMHVYNASDKGIYDVWLLQEKMTPKIFRYIVEQLSIHRTNSRLKKKELESYELFMQRHKVKTGDYTHTSLTGGKWNIPIEVRDLFYEIYTREVGKRELHLTEKHIPNCGPIVIDMDFKFKEEPQKRLINKKLIVRIVDTLTQILKTIFGYRMIYDCYVLQRPQVYKKKDCYCDGLHIQFPNVVCEYMYQYELRSQFIKNFEFGIECENKIEDIYDKSVIDRNNWCMYRSTKQDIPPYKVVRILNSNKNINDYTVLEMVKILSIRNKTFNTMVKPINSIEIGNRTELKEVNVDIEEKVAELGISKDQTIPEQTIRKLLNMLDNKRVNDYEEWIKIGLILHNCSITNGDDEIDYFKLWDTWSSKSKKYDKKECAKQWEHFKKAKGKRPLSIASLFYFAKLDNPEAYHGIRIDDYLSKQKDVFPDNNLAVTKIINKGHTCYAELNDDYCPFIKGRHDTDYKTIYMEVTSGGLCLKCKECPYEILPVGGHIKLPNKTLGSVFGIDNVYNNITINNNYDAKNILETFAIHKSEFTVFEDKTLNELVYLSLNGTGYKIAELVLYLYKDVFRCTSDDTWFEYQNHRWRSGAPILFQLLSSHVTEYHHKLYDFYNTLQPNNPEEAEHNQFMKQVISSIIRNLETTSFKNSIMKDICTTFYLNNKEFENELNKKPFLIGFENGVYDLEKYEFRDGLPTDNISMSVGYEYIGEHTEHRNELMKFLEDILPNKDDRTFLLKYISTGLCAWNYEEIAVILSGKTRNGKTKLKELINYTLGEYFVTFASNLLTMPRPSAEKPVPELMAFINKRFALGAEPEANSTINSGFYKFITGNETMPGRGLYDKKIMEIKPTHKIGILCNKIPSFDAPDDPAIWTRTKCVEFPITFVANPTKPNEKPIDKTIGEKLVLWKQDFMLVLIEYFKRFKEEGLVETAGITKFTTNYREVNDVFLQFLEECTESAETHVHTSEIYVHFKNWFIENNPRTRIPSNRVFVANIRSHRVVEQVRVGGKNTLGIKNIGLINKVTNDNIEEI